ncbi:hypothetical protein [Variovorax paradoxus]|uniref:hypothetical protein n=1 Tax=Variovorax paradoxus TaxID=34073 RepID=UPI0029C603CB|nr:hypothetical protein [Variovorax paradoxus]WPH22306.1 hypothetical protein RZE78_09110 [Variovorax paradoxus]
MQLTFRGWNRVQTLHTHAVTPVRIGADSRLRPHPNRALIWDDATSTYGKVSDLSLGGSFLVHFQFEQADLEGWLAEFAKSQPEEALRLLAKIQAEALIHLAKPPSAKV